MPFDGLNVEELRALRKLTFHWKDVTEIFRQEGPSDWFWNQLQAAVDAGAQLFPIGDWTLSLKDNQDRRPFNGMSRQEQEDILAEITNLWEEVVNLLDAQRLRKVPLRGEESPFRWVFKVGTTRGLIKTVFPELNHQ